MDSERYPCSGVNVAVIANGTEHLRCACRRGRDGTTAGHRIRASPAAGAASLELVTLDSILTQRQNEFTG